MSKLIEDRKVCWVGEDGGWNVGVTFLNDGLREGDEDNTLVRHKHTGDLEWIPHRCLSNYPIEPIPEPGDVGSCSGGASQPAYDGPATDHPKVDFGYPPGIRKFAAGDTGLLTGDEARKRNAELGRELKNLEDWKHGFEAAKKTGIMEVKDGMLSNEQVKAIAKAQLDHDLNNRIASTPSWPRETDLAWGETETFGPGLHVLTQDDLAKLEEAAARRAEKIARVKAMEDSLAKWQPVKPKLSDLYRGNQTLCIGVMPE